MKKAITGLAFVALAAIGGAGVALADNGAIQTMARITMNLNHFASDADKETLTGIVDSDASSEEEAAIAMAITNLQHKVTEADAQRLKDIVADDSVDAKTRDLAGIVLRINHSASAEDKAELAAIAGE